MADFQNIPSLFLVFTISSLHFFFSTASKLLTFVRKEVLCPSQAQELTEQF